jgi:hypothetical protein
MMQDLLIRLRQLRQSVPDDTFEALEMVILFAEETERRPISAASKMLCARALESILSDRDIPARLRACRADIELLFQAR